LSALPSAGNGIGACEPKAREALQKSGRNGARASKRTFDRTYDGASRKVSVIMVSKAIARFARISVRKARVIADLVRGRQAGEALQLLEFTNKAGAPVLKKVIESAVANARTVSPNVDLDSLFIETAFVDKAPNKHMRRWRPRAMGRATRIQKGTSHITIHLGTR
jgi:large subunit ribosomal protein L22